KVNRRAVRSECCGSNQNRIIARQCLIEDEASVAIGIGFTIEARTGYLDFCARDSSTRWIFNDALELFGNRQKQKEQEAESGHDLLPLGKEFPCFPLNRSPDFAVAISRSPSHMRFAMQCRTRGGLYRLQLRGNGGFSPPSRAFSGVVQ